MVDINPDGVRTVGNELYPALADIYEEVGEKVLSASRLAVPDQSSLESSLSDYLAKIAGCLQVSDLRLRDCGNALVEVADSLETVDEDNAKSIANPETGLPEGDGKMREGEGDPV